MDRRVKERLIGASILVVLIVLIVPELLSGPAPAPVAPRPLSTAGPVRSVTVDLATSQTPEPAPAPASVPAETVASSVLPPDSSSEVAPSSQAVPVAAGAPRAPAQSKAAPR